MARRKRYNVTRWFKVWVDQDILATDLDDAVAQAKEMVRLEDFDVVKNDGCFMDVEVIGEPSINSP